MGKKFLNLKLGFKSGDVINDVVVRNTSIETIASWVKTKMIYILKDSNDDDRIIDFGEVQNILVEEDEDEDE